MKLRSIIRACACSSIIAAILSGSAIAEFAPFKDTPWAPAGVRIGMPLGEAGAALEAAGYTRLTDCSFGFGAKGTPARGVLMSTDEAKPNMCGGVDEPVMYWEYTENEIVGNADSAFAAIEAATGGSASCSRRFEEGARCNIVDPTKVDGIAGINVNLSAMPGRDYGVFRVTGRADAASGDNAAAVTDVPASGPAKGRTPKNGQVDPCDLADEDERAAALCGVMDGLF
ncbi:MAG: hypothetical protein KDA46_10240 [Parvularculaceae bacterium]|nr:hypothetical protein [Parvularculaceae bacterium]